MRGELPAFGHYIGEYEDQPDIVRTALEFMVNDLPDRASVLRWYLEINKGGTPHTEAEIRKVESLLAEELA